jgi:hypothetical protein
VKERARKSRNEREKLKIVKKKISAEHWKISLWKIQLLGDCGTILTVLSAFFLSRLGEKLFNIKPSKKKEGDYQTNPH